MHSLARRLTALLALLLLASLGTTQSASAQGTSRRGKVISAGSRPGTDSFRAMLQREARIQAAMAAGMPGRIRLRKPPMHEEPGKPRQIPDEQHLFAAPVRRAPLALGGSFKGIGLSDEIAGGLGTYVPPDTMGAVGPSHFVELINGSFNVFTKSGSRVGRVFIDTFFAIPGTTHPLNGAFDPRILYDRRSGHWFACALEFGQQSPPPDNDFFDNDLILAVSRTSDPTGLWDKYLIPVGNATTGGTRFFTDFETLGVDDNGVYFGDTIFASNNDAFEEIAATPKASLIAAGPSLGAVTEFSSIRDMYSSPQPALNFDSVPASGPAWLVAASAAVLGNVTYRTITWSGGAPTLSGLGTVSTPSFQFPVNIPASGSTQTLDQGDMRILSALVRNGRLWACRNVGVNSAGTSSGADRTAAEWMELSLSGSIASLRQTGRIFDTAAANPRHYYYPGVMVNGQGHASLACSGSSSSEFVGVYACSRLASDAPGTMTAPQLIKAGEDAYTLLGGSLNRWGDYSLTSLDPVDDMTFWTVQEYAATGPNRWGTWIQKVLAPGPTLTSVTGSATAGQTGVSITLAGAGFYDPGAGFARPAVSFVAPGGGTAGGFTNVSVNVAGAASATVTFDVAGTVAAGSYGVTFTNPDGQAVTLPASLSITASGPPTVQFSPATYLVAEGSSTTVTVTRSGDTSGASTVSYATSNGSALAGSDYNAASGTLSFAAGETSKTFSVSALIDGVVEGTESFNLTLSAPTGATLGTQSNAVVNIQDRNPPNAPSSLSFTSITDTSVGLSWLDGSSDETGFKVERSTNGVSFTTVGTTAANAASFTDTTVSPETAYFYQVRATNAVGDSNPTNVVSLTTAPAAPSGLTAAALTSRSVQLNWTDNSAETGFSIERKSGSGSFAQVGAAAQNATTFTDTTALPHTTYVYQVRATGVSASSSPSNQATVTTPSEGPNPPTALTAAQRIREIDLSWTDNSSDETSFKVERRAGLETSFTQVRVLAANVTTFVDTAVDPNTTYTYRVRASNATGDSDYSNTAGATTPADNPGAKLVISPKKLNFKTVKGPKSKTLKLKLTNKGKESLTVLVIAPGDPFTVQSPAPVTVPPKKSVTVLVTFTPPAAGVFTGAYTVYSTATSAPSTPVPATGKRVEPKRR